MKIKIEDENLFIEFTINEKVKANDIFLIDFSPDNEEHYFMATTVETLEDLFNHVKVSAQEVGNDLSRSDIDIRDMRHSNVTKITDNDKIKSIRNQRRAY